MARPTKKRGRSGAGRTYVAGEKAIRALASPLRMEILQSFSDADRLTVRDIAGRVGKSRGSLYYHVRKLEEIGLLAEAERRLVGRRYEIVYEVKHERISVVTDPDSATGRDASIKFVWSALRQAGREFETAIEKGLLEDRDDFQVGQRQRAWLTEADLVRVESLLERAAEICARASRRRKGKLYAVTSLIVPLLPPPPDRDREA